MDKIAEQFQYFLKNHKDIYEAYSNYGKAIHEKGGPLDEKTRALIKVAVSSACGKMYALETHIKKALSQGNDYESIEHTILLTAPTAGFPSMMESLLVLRRVYDENI